MCGCVVVFSNADSVVVLVGSVMSVAQKSVPDYMHDANSEINAFMSVAQKSVPDYLHDANSEINAYSTNLLIYITFLFSTSVRSRVLSV